MEILTGTIYALFDSTGLRYVGQTVKKPNHRLYQHKKQAKANTLKGDWLLDKADEIYLEVLGNYPISELDKMESYWINYFNLAGCLLLNSSKPGHYNIPNEAKEYFINRNCRAKVIKRNDQISQIANLTSQIANLNGSIKIKNIYISTLEELVETYKRGKLINYDRNSTYESIIEQHKKTIEYYEILFKTVEIKPKYSFSIFGYRFNIFKT